MQSRYINSKAMQEGRQIGVKVVLIEVIVITICPLGTSQEGSIRKT